MSAVDPLPQLSGTSVGAGPRIVSTHPSPKRSWKGWRIGEFDWVWIATAALFGISALIAPGTVRLGSLLAMAPFASLLAIVAVGQTLVIRQRGLDMSAGGMMTLSGLLVADLAVRSGSIWMAAIATIVASGCVGLVSGLLVARVHISPIVATLAMNALLIGGVRGISGGTPLVVPVPLQTFAHAPFFGIPLSFALASVFVAVTATVINSTITGRRFIAVGASPAAAAASGVRVLRYHIGAYVAASTCFGVAGIILAGYIGFASQSAGNDYLLPGVVAVVVGGTPFGGGRGSVVASAGAALFMAQLGQLVLSLGANSATQLLVQAAAIVLAVAVRSLPAFIASLSTRRAS
jgi:ribose transport system permease protein